ncbi:MAG: CinA family protein [Magnetococcales bacterium]|nr:CinA family protein [Magnetococcales bacterium]MBF0157093.1 CinA family protein [Magnetococcales bacterium]
MKCLIVVPRWCESEALIPPTGRPHLDLALHCLGFEGIGVWELDPEAPFDPTTVPEEFALVLVQGREDTGNRQRRSILSSLGLSLGLDAGSGRLRVVGARPLLSEEGTAAGFATNRRGRMVIYCERPIWELLGEVILAIKGMLVDIPHNRRGRTMVCRLLEGDGGPFKTDGLLSEEEQEQCLIRNLPDGDAAILIPDFLGESLTHRLRNRLGKRLYGDSPLPLEEWLGRRLVQAGLRVAVAESCTGGLISARITSIAGSSRYFIAGYVTYANTAKQQALNIPEVLLNRCGAVSPEVALAMARNALRAADSDLAVSVTGIAGPEGGSSQKPVGTVRLAAVDRQGAIIEQEGHYAGNRESIRFQTSQTALHLLRRMLPGGLWGI